MSEPQISAQRKRLAIMASTQTVLSVGITPLLKHHRTGQLVWITLIAIGLAYILVQTVMISRTEKR